MRGMPRIARLVERETSARGLRPPDRSPVALLAPGIGAVVVPVALPEAELISLDDADPLEPLGALPEVFPRHEAAQREAVLGGEVDAVVKPDDGADRGHDVVDGDAG